MKKATLLSLLLILCLYGSAQEELHPDHSWMIRGNFQTGIVLPEYGFMKEITNDYIRSGELSIARVSRDNGLWDHLYRFPGFGMSFFFTTMGSKEHFGNQFSLYPYYSLNLLRRHNFECSYQMGIGASYATKKYSADQNYQNLAIGSHLNIHYHADLVAQYHLHNRLFVNAGISFSHISNANLSEPNVGINTCALYVGLGYAIGKPDTAHHTVNFEYTPHFVYEVMVAGGMKHTRTFESFQYPAFSVSFDAKRRFTYKFSLGIGADFFYDSSTEPQMKRLNKPFSPSDSYTSGIHLAQEFIYNRLSLIVQEGVYIGLTDHLNGYSMYNRAIARFHVSEHLFVNASMKTHLYILDFPELGIGYSW